MAPMDLGPEGGEDIEGIGAPGEEGNDVKGNEESVDMGDASNVDQGTPLQENRGRVYFKQYMNMLHPEKALGSSIGRVKPISENMLINEELTDMAKQLDEIIGKDEETPILTD